MTREQKYALDGVAHRLFGEACRLEHDAAEESEPWPIARLIRQAKLRRFEAEALLNAVNSQGPMK